METDSDIETICKQIQEKAMKATKCSVGIKSSELNYYKSFIKFNKMIDHQSIQSLAMISSLIQNENNGTKMERIVSDEDKYELITDINDNIFDKIGNHLDEASGLKKKAAELVLATISSDKQKAINTSSWNRNVIKAKRIGNTNLLSAKMIERSQLRFKDKIDNSNKPFVPIIKDKPNSLKPLSILVEKTEDGFDSYSHPYEFEIEKFEPKEDFLEIEIPKMPKPVDETDFKFVDKKEELIDLIQTLKAFKVIAVDLEHHSYRTFQGFTCLMQISCESCDYVIDTIELRSEMHLLNEVFTSPSILKVFHGADMDILWLQRDFGLYVVNLFDTYQSAKLLEFPHLSLSYLLKHYCNFDANKQFQLADWRIRPLTDQLIKYAREDTHYLVFIYIQMKNSLIAKGNKEKNLLRAVFERSKAVCLKKYEKPLFNSESYRLLLKKSRVNFNAKQLYALKELYAWRDRMARNDDESIGYVLPNHMLLHLAEVLPREQQGILASCNPIPPLVKQQLNEIHLIILKAREKPLTSADDNSGQQSNVSQLLIRNIDFDEMMDCREDKFSLDSDLNTQTLIDEFSDLENIERVKSENSDPLVPSENNSIVFEFFKRNKSPNQNEMVESIRSSFMSLFERYKQTIDYKRRAQNEAEDTTNKNKAPNESNSNLSRVYSHYLNLTTNL